VGKPISCSRTATQRQRNFRNSSTTEDWWGTFPGARWPGVGLSRAYAVQGETAKARAAYQDFFTLWKGADPDIPILKQAKAEYARLK